MNFFVADSVTTLGADMRGRAVIAASHAGTYAAYLAAQAGVGGVILCDAGIGRERAGVSGLNYLERNGVPAAAVGHRSARIGDGEDCARRGVLSCVNVPAAVLGLRAGMMAAEAMQILSSAALTPAPVPPPQREARRRLSEAEAPGVQVHAMDSAALITSDDRGYVVLTGSHGGLLGGRPETAAKHPVFAAVYNDAAFGVDDAGISRLPALEARGIAGATVSAWSARIGDGLATFRDGYVSAVNDRAAAYGAKVGISARELVKLLVAARGKELR